MVHLSVATTFTLVTGLTGLISTAGAFSHRHSFFPSRPVEPTDQNLRVSHHQVQFVNVSGFREWELKADITNLLTSEKAVSIAEMVPPMPYHKSRTHELAALIVNPEGLFSPQTVIAGLIAKQQKQQGAGETGPALIDLILKDGHAVFKAIWPVDGEQTITIQFDTARDKVIEVGWFYREVTEREDNDFEHYLGAIVHLDKEGEKVSEAMVHARASVFPPHRRDPKAKENIVAFGHGFEHTMSPKQTLHPHSVTKIQSDPTIAATTANCELLVVHVLPATVFVDPFQLADLAPEIGPSVVFGETDLEKPVGVVSGWGSVVMNKVQPKENERATSRWIWNETGRFSATVDIPMHTRYQPPVAAEDPATHVEAHIPWPIVAWKCPNLREEDKAKKLFYVPPLPLSLLIAPEDSHQELRFLLPDPIPEHYPSSPVLIPVGRLEDLEFVRIATFALAGAGTCIVSLALIKAVYARSNQIKGKQD
ncbi:protease B nonderepressible form [Actinomortierella wolfii]|nr:protease B nonderepressible form [Actinomortierella wolfii]